MCVNFSNSKIRFFLKGECIFSVTFAKFLAVSLWSPRP